MKKVRLKMCIRTIRVIVTFHNGGEVHIRVEKVTPQLEMIGLKIMKGYVKESQ